MFKLGLSKEDSCIKIFYLAKQTVDFSFMNLLYLSVCFAPGVYAIIVIMREGGTVPVGSTFLTEVIC